MREHFGFCMFVQEYLQDLQKFQLIDRLCEQERNPFQKKRPQIPLESGI
jgi:hypothetical protein